MTYKYGDEAQKLMSEPLEWCHVEGSKIAEFYKEKNVFVTGATGFFGKLLVEKLLRACPGIKEVFILVRPKKGEDEHGRVDKLYSDEIFGPLSKLNPKFQHKISIIKGDISLPNLGMSLSNIQLLKEKISVFFHAAATVRFDEKINVATAINVRGTRDLLNIAKECRNLESFVYVSTAYANCNQKEIDEVFYKTPITADELIELVEKTPEAALIQQTPKILREWPNSYTFTKAIAEDAVQKYGMGLPVCVVRPAIVIATYKEPVRSWIDNLYGATGIVVGAGTGLLKTIHCDRDKTAELVPGDYVINSLIAASYRTAVEKNIGKIPIYNYVSSVENHHTWTYFMEKCETWGQEIPSIRCIWYHCLTMNKYYPIHLLYTIFLHYLPALLMDFGLVLARQRPIMLKIYKKITKFESVISHFCTNEWKFYNDNTQLLWNYICDADQKMFPFSMRQLDWNEYYKTHMLGLRLHLLKEDISTLPQLKMSLERQVRAKLASKRDPQQDREAQEWIETVLGAKFPPGEKYEDVLKDGTVLCQLINKLAPGSVPKINTSGGQFKLMENINNFQAAIKAYGVNDVDVFQTVDLWEQKDIAQITNTIFALGRQTYKHPEWPGPWLGPRPSDENKREFTEEQLRAGESVIGLQAGQNKGASQAGQNIGAGRKIILGK